MGGRSSWGSLDGQGQGRIILSGGSAGGRRGGDGPREGLPAPGTQPAGGRAHGSPPRSGRTGLETVYHCWRSSRVASAGIPGSSGPQGGDGAGEGRAGDLECGAGTCRALGLTRGHHPLGSHLLLQGEPGGA